MLGGGACGGIDSTAVSASSVSAVRASARIAAAGGMCTKSEGESSDACSGWRVRGRRGTRESCLTVVTGLRIDAVAVSCDTVAGTAAGRSCDRALVRSVSQCLLRVGDSSESGETTTASTIRSEPMAKDTPTSNSTLR